MTCRLLLMLCFLLWPLVAQSATYCVSPTGSNAASGVSPACWQTIQFAANTMASGDTVNIAAGQYYERVLVTNDNLTFRGVAGTIVDGSDPLTGWIDQGSGYWRVATPGYSPFAMTVGSQKLTVLRLLDSMMGGTVCTLCSGTGLQVMARAASNSYWEGIEAVFGVTGGFVYVRFRNGENPDTLAVRVGPGGATNSGAFVLNGTTGVTLGNMEIGGSTYAVHMIDGTANIVENCTLRNGRARVRIDGGDGNIVRNSSLDGRLIGSTAGYAATPYTAGSWFGPASAQRTARQNIYNVDKFEVGATREQNSGVMVDNATASAVNTAIYGNTITGGSIGVELQDAHGTSIYNNAFSYHSAESIWPNETSGATANAIYNNTFFDANHQIRIQSMENNHPTLYIYQNWFHQPIENSKHIHFSFGTPTAASPNVVYIYHNTFTGDGWATDLGGTGEGTKQIADVRIVNNLISVDGYHEPASSTGGVSSGGLSGTAGTTGYVGMVAYNWCTSSCSGIPGSGGNHVNNLGSHGGALVWADPYNTNPLAPPAGHGTLDSGIRLDQDWTINSVTRSALPGMTSQYYGDALPDRGFYQVGAEADTTPPAISITAPIAGALVSGTAVMLAATASDDVGVVGVQFKVDGANVGNEDTSSPYMIAWDSTTVTDGMHILTAVARDAATNSTTSAGIQVSVDNLPLAFLNDPSGLNITGNTTVSFVNNPSGVGIVP